MAAITLYREAKDALGCDFAVIERLDVHAVIDSYRRLYAQGWHGEPPAPVMYQRFFDKGPNWVCAVLPLDYLDFQTEDESSQERVRRARQYAARGTPFPPGIASYGGRARQRRTGKAYVQDGNHRVLAAHFRGDCAIEMFMPEDEFYAVVEDARWRDDGAGEMRETVAREQGQFDKYRSLPADPDRGSPRSAYGPPSYHLVGDYWTVPVVVPLESLSGLRATAIDKARLRSVQQARREGVRLPPIEIGVFQNGSGWIVDGNHRLVAARRAKDDAIEVVFTFVPDVNPRHVSENTAEFFHVTSSTNRELIRKRGLSPSRGWISGPGVFVTTNPHSWLFMFEDSGIYSDAPAVDIWAVDVSGLELVPDDNETADPDQDFRVIAAIIPASRVRLVETIE